MSCQCCQKPFACLDWMWTLQQCRFLKDLNPDQGSADAEADPDVSKSRVMERALVIPVEEGTPQGRRLLTEAPHTRARPARSLLSLQRMGTRVADGIR